MINRYTWNLYLKSGGSKVVDMFRRNIEQELTEEYAEEIIRLKKYFCIMTDIAEDEGRQIKDLIQINKELEEKEIEEDLFESDALSDKKDTMSH